MTTCSLQEEPPYKKRRVGVTKHNSNSFPSEKKTNLDYHTVNAQIRNVDKIKKSSVNICFFLRPDAHKLDTTKCIDATFDKQSIDKLSTNHASNSILCRITYNKHSSTYQLLSILSAAQIADAIQLNVNKCDKILKASNAKLSIYNASDDDKLNALTSSTYEFTQMLNRKRKKRFEHHKLLNLRDINIGNISLHVLCEWFTAQTVNKQVEIESKIGKFVPKLKSIETHPFIIHSKEIYRRRFTPGVDDEIYKDLISNNFNKWWKTCNAQRNNRLFPKVKYFETKTMDEFYHRTRMRSTYNLNSANNIFLVKTIEKKKVNKDSTINIACPGLDFDLRISASLEYKGTKPTNAAIKMIRFKHRRYYFYDYFSVQITEIYQYDKNLNMNFIKKCMLTFAKKRNVLDIIEMQMDQNKYGARRVFEIELEINKEYLFDCVQDVKKNNDTEKLMDLIYHFNQSSIKLAQLVSSRKKRKENELQ